MLTCKGNILEDERSTAVLHPHSNENISNDSIVATNIHLNAMGEISMQMLKWKVSPSSRKGQTQCTNFFHRWYNSISKEEIILIYSKKFGSLDHEVALTINMLLRDLTLKEFSWFDWRTKKK